MTKTIEKYFCDICGKESSFKLTGKIDIENGSDYPLHKYIHNKEVCTECCNRIINFVTKKKEIENNDK